MNNVKILKSQEDASVNFIIEGDYPGYQEARYVRRKPEYMIIYISSQTGCNQGCRFCHLTTTKQTKLVDISIENMVDQARHILEYYAKNEPKAHIAHVNFMSRGEALANKIVLENGSKLLTSLNEEILKYDLQPKFLISTIMPHSLVKSNKTLADIFIGHNNIAPIFYYSIYSLDPLFRKKWLPNAMDPKLAMTYLYDYQQVTNQNIKLHWAFIKDENDSSENIDQILNLINQSKIKTDINIVRYNPYSEIYGQESDYQIILDRVKQLQNSLPQSKIKIIDRVGIDVKASCGTFIA